MRLKLLFAFLDTLLDLPAVAFEYTYEGQTVYYYFKDNDAKICAVSGEETDNLGDVMIPSVVKYGEEEYTVTEICNNAFKNNTKITFVVIPNTVKIIKEWAFRRCVNLTYVQIGNSVETIERQVFQDSAILKSVRLPNSVTTLDCLIS